MLGFTIIKSLDFKNINDSIVAIEKDNFRKYGIVKRK
jgi:hypothetical protein